MKEFHLNIVHAVVSALQQIFEENKYADKVIEKLLRSNPKWGSRDRKFIAETTYEVVRWHRLLRYVQSPETEIAVNHWHTLAAWFIISKQAFPKWKEFEGVNAKQILENYEHAKKVRALRESIPNWMDSLISAELGEATWDKEIGFLNNQAGVVLRVNTLKKSVKHLQNELATDGIATYTVQGFPDALVLERRQNIFQTQQFQKGYFEVQDAGSQLIASFLKVGEGMRVIDACAGAGGKSLHLAAQMQNKGKLIAMDIEAWKLDELQKRAKRAGVSNIETRPIEGTKTIKRLEETADRLLLDVPCSGLGVLRRNPDAKWKLSMDFIEKVRKTQAEILESYSRMLKVDGQMVYATCSLLPSENRNQVDQFIASQNGRFEFIEDRSVMPSEGFDGFYMARLVRKR